MARLWCASGPGTELLALEPSAWKCSWAPARQGELRALHLLVYPQQTGVPRGCAAGTELSTGGTLGQEL